MSGGNYQRSVFRQLEETIQRLDRMEKQHEEDTWRLGQEHRRETEAVKASLNEKIEGLQAKVTEQAKKRIEHLEQENQLLRDDNDRLKSILNQDSNNSSQPPSSDQKGKRANQYNNREKSGKRAVNRGMRARH